MNKIDIGFVQRNITAIDLIMAKFLELAAIGAMLAVLAAGCTTRYGTPDYTGTGALVGGATGAGLGAVIDRRNPAAGALIGGVAGLITGGLIGHSMDEQARQPVYVAAPPPPPSPGYVWVPGAWVWTGSAWVWVAGHWIAAP